MAKRSTTQCVFIFRARDGVFMIREDNMKRHWLTREDRNLHNGRGMAKFKELAEFYSLPFSKERTKRLHAVDVKKPGVLWGHSRLTLRPFLCECNDSYLARCAGLRGCLRSLDAHDLCKQIPIPPLVVDEDVDDEDGGTGELARQHA